MKVFVNIKAVGKRRPALEKKPCELPDSVATLRGLLTEIVRTEVENYNKKGVDAPVVDFLTQGELKEKSAAGKIGFGRIYSDKKADEKKAVKTAVQCFEDGMFRVFKNEDELTSLDENINLKENDVLTFIRLTFLAGRLW